MSAQQPFPATIPLSSTPVTGDGAFINGAVGAGARTVAGIGDFDGDSIADFAVATPLSSPGGKTNAGQVFIVHGKPGLGSSGPLNVSALSNGVDGWMLEGKAGDQLGFSMAGIGDWNQDGKDDFIVCSPYADPGSKASAGECYIVPGRQKAATPGPGVIDLASDGSIITFQGGSAGDKTGYSAGGRGDYNGDGIPDALIGARDASPPGRNGAGKTFLLFGGQTYPAVITEATMTPFGITFHGSPPAIITPESSGYAVSFAGSMTGDAFDEIIIGAPNGGHAYFVFGRNLTLPLSMPTIVDLSTLNGTIGFIVKGGISNNPPYQTGSTSAAVSRLGDINDDGFADVAVGSFATSIPSGTSYEGMGFIIYGDPGVGTSGLISLNSFGSPAGSRIHGASPGDYMSYALSPAGDINGDFISDFMIDAAQADVGGLTDAGKIHVIFGDRNLRSLSQITISSLTGTYGGFTLTGEFDSQFCGRSLAGGEDYNDDDLPDMLIGTSADPASVGRLGYLVFGRNVTQPASSSSSSSPVSSSPSSSLVSSSPVSSSFTGSSPLSSSSSSYSGSSSSSGGAVVLYPPQMAFNQFGPFSNGDSFLLTESQLSAISSNPVPGTIKFITGNIQNCYFTLVATNTTVTLFFQQDIYSRAIRFHHDGSGRAPALSVIASETMDDGSVLQTLSGPTTMLFTGAPIFTQNLLVIERGGISSPIFNITVTDGSTPDEIMINFLDMSHLLDPLTSIPLFSYSSSLAALSAQPLQLAQDGSTQAPDYKMEAKGKSGSISQLSRVQTIFFDQAFYAPRIDSFEFDIKQGGSRILTPLDLKSSKGDGSALGSSDRFIVSSTPEHCSLSLSSNPLALVNSFTVQNLKDGVVTITHDGSRSLPYFLLSALSSGLQSGQIPPAIYFILRNSAPVLSQAIPDQQAFTDKVFSLSVDDALVDPDGDLLTWYAYENGSDPSVGALPPGISFYPDRLSFGGVPTTTGSSYIKVGAADPDGLFKETGFFLLINSSTSSSTSLWKLYLAIIGGAIGFGFTIASQLYKRHARKTLQSIVDAWQEPYQKLVVTPVALRIYNLMKLTGFMNRTTRITLEQYTAAITKICTQLKTHGVDIAPYLVDDTAGMTTDREAIINTIATTIFQHFVPERERATCWRERRCSAEVTPDQLDEAANAIAAAAAATLKDYFAKVSSSEIKDRKSKEGDVGATASYESPLRSPSASPRRLSGGGHSLRLIGTTPRTPTTTPLVSGGEVELGGLRAERSLTS